ncbi:hypothetical protein EV702DRAFT_1199734 [Suillus placidus]|uniref:Uncharacterized protein n=1 Tax=Suillus placidus TaxID=48579 RepID=A0A9P7D0M2_9AGAM|nr:hypothetical protein EV702DRAFT_1199734 [Suillus placidus]
MISITFYVASRLAITGLISVSFFEETVLRPIRSGSRKVSAGLVVSAFKSTIILILAADEAASTYLSNDTSAPSTGGHISDAAPAAPSLLRMACTACKLHQGTPGRHPPVNFILPDPAQKFFSSFQSSSSSPVFRSTTLCDITTLDLPYFANCKRLSITPDTSLVACDDDRLKDVLLPFHHYLSPPVLESTPSDITTTLDLPNLAICNRLSITSDTTLVASDDDSTELFFDKDNYATPHPGVRAPTHTTTNDDRVDVPASSTTINIISPFCTPYIRPLVLLVDNCQTTPTSTTNHCIPGSAHLSDTLLQTTKTVDSLHSSPSIVLNDDFIHLEGVFSATDKTLDIKDAEPHINTLPPHTSVLAADNALIEHTLPIENALAICNIPSHPLILRPLALLDSSPTSLSTNIGTNPSGSAHPTDALAHKTKAAASWLKPLILVTKYAGGQLILLPPTALPYQPEKSRPYKLKQQKRKPRASRMNAACHSIVRSRLRRHANRIVGHLAQVCEQIRVDKADLMDAWVTAMAEVGLTSMLAGNHPTSPGSPLPHTFDAFSVLEPGLRIKARIASLRHRTNAVAAAIPATTAFLPSIPATHFPTSPASYARRGFNTYNTNNHRLLKRPCDNPPRSQATD